MNGNSFNGLIPEVPGLGVDRFNNGATVFLLTHCHTDHLGGLENKNFSGTIYCSQVTKDLLGLNKTYRHNMKYVRALDMDQQYSFHIQKVLVTITLISAYHCPGAAMFLIETQPEDYAHNSGCKTILCTGDLRAESWWLDSLRNNNPYLFPYSNGLGAKKIDIIYLDTTFGYRGEPYIQMLSNNEGINVAISLIKSYPLEDPDIQFFFTDSILGFEEAWVKIAKTFSKKVHLSKDLKKRLQILGGVYEEIIGDQDPEDKTSSFHACGATSKCKAKLPRATSEVANRKFNISIRQCINFNAIDFTGVFLPLSIEDLTDKETRKELQLVGETELGNKIYKFRGREWILPQGRRELLPSEIKLIFSRHSSYMECCNLVKSFQPRQVYPCVDSESTWHLGMQMSRVFGKLCCNNQPPQISDFRYDKKKVVEWGLPKNNVRERPIKVIDRWNLLDCKQEMEIAMDFLQWQGAAPSDEDHFRKKVSSPIQFKFKGQHWTSKFSNPNYSEDDARFDLARKKDFQLQNLVIGRGERAYKNIIQDLQNNYRNLLVDKGRGFIYDKQFTEDDLHEEVNRDADLLKLGGLDGYNYDKDSNSVDESYGKVPSSEIEVIPSDVETDIDDDPLEDSEIEIEDTYKIKNEYGGSEVTFDRERKTVSRAPSTLGVPSQMLHVGDCLMLKRASSSMSGIEDHPTLKRQTTSLTEVSKSSFVLSFHVSVSTGSSEIRVKSEHMDKEIPQVDGRLITDSEVPAAASHTRHIEPFPEKTLKKTFQDSTSPQPIGQRTQEAHDALNINRIESVRCQLEENPLCWLGIDLKSRK